MKRTPTYGFASKTDCIISLIRGGATRDEIAEHLDLNCERLGAYLSKLRKTMPDLPLPPARAPKGGWRGLMPTAIPTLGHPTMSAAVLALLRSGRTREEVMAMTGASRHQIGMIVYRSRRAERQRSQTCEAAA